jgi:hypothetical protein
MNAKTQTETVAPAVYSAIAAVMGDLAKSGISKDQTNTFDKYKFRGIDDVYNALAPLLSKHGLLILPRVTERTSEERTSKNGGAVFYVTVAVEFDFVAASDGSTHTIRAYGEAMDRGDKGTNKAMTAAYKYACFEAFCIPVVGSDDADAETHEVEAQASVAQEWIDAIDAIDSVEALDALGADIAKSGISASAKTKVRAAFAARKHAFDKVAA